MKVCEHCSDPDRRKWIYHPNGVCKKRCLRSLLWMHIEPVVKSFIDRSNQGLETRDAILDQFVGTLEKADTKRRKG